MLKINSLERHWKKFDFYSNYL